MEADETPTLKDLFSFMQKLEDRLLANIDRNRAESQKWMGALSTRIEAIEARQSQMEARQSQTEASMAAKLNAKPAHTLAVFVNPAATNTQIQRVIHDGGRPSRS